jgi:SAM-dependent methyltransferase
MSSYFSRHWRSHQLKELPEAKVLVAQYFLTPLLESGDGTWLDVGTGDGVHLQVIQSLRSQVRMLGLDISPAAIAACKIRAPRSFLMLADAQEIPLQDQSVDAAFSFGVLAYLDDPWRALSEMIRVTRTDGLIGVWIYPDSESFTSTLFKLVRTIVPTLPSPLQLIIANCIVPFLGFLPTTGGVHLGNASWAACCEVIMVNIAPPKLIFPSQREVVKRIVELGCRIIQTDDDRPITLWAIKE